MFCRMKSSIHKLLVVSRGGGRSRDAVSQCMRFHTITKLGRLAYPESIPPKSCLMPDNRDAIDNSHCFKSTLTTKSLSPLTGGDLQMKAGLRMHCRFCMGQIQGVNSGWNSTTLLTRTAEKDRVVTATMPLLQRAFHTCQGALYAGHNKWSKVKYIKGPKDLEKSRVFTRIGMQVKIAIKEGGPNPETNAALAGVISLAKAKAMPKTTLDTMIKKAAASKQGDTQQTFEVRGPGNSSLLVSVLTDNPRRTRMELTHLTSKNGGTFGEQGTAMFAFQKKGVLRVPCEVKGQESMNFDDAEELAIDAGAEEVKEGADDEGQSIYMFICDPAELRLVRDSLDHRSLPVLSSGLEFVAQTTIALSNSDMEAAATLINALEEHEHVVRVFDNIVGEE